MIKQQPAIGSTKFEVAPDGAVYILTYTYPDKQSSIPRWHCTSVLRGEKAKNFLVAQAQRSD